MRPIDLTILGTIFATLLSSTARADDCNGNGLPDNLDVAPEPAFLATPVATSDFPYALTSVAIDKNGMEVPLDVNGDGHADVALAHHVPGAASVHLNDGSGNFGSSTYLPLAPFEAAWSIAAGDVDADDDHDLLLLASDPFAVHVLLNDGTGNFTFDETYPQNSSCLHGTLADLDDDDDLDLAVVQPGNVQIMINDGAGNFSNGDSRSVPAGSKSIAAADFDGDNDLDLAVDSFLQYTILLNNGTATFPFSAQYPAGATLTSIIASDVTGDGLPDIIGASAISSVVVMARNLGGATFASTDVYFVDSSPGWLVAADLDGDGDNDVAATDAPFSVDAEVVVLRNAGDGTFAGPVYATAGGIAEAPGITAADYDGNGTIDLAVGFDGSVNGGAIWILSNDPLAPLSADCNGNGVLDECDIRSMIDLDPAVAFPTGVEPVAVLASAVDPQHNVFPLDLDGNGFIDLVTGNENGNTLSVLLNNGVDGDGNWLGYAAAMDYPTGAGPTGLAAGDLDGDGFTDLAGASVLGGDIDVLYNDGNGDFPDVDELLNEDNTPDVCMADFDGDGQLDLACTGANANQVFVVLNDGNRTFAPQVDHDVGTTPRGLAHGDIDQDGFVDLATANVNGGSVSILHNKADGTGGFDPHIEIEFGSEPFHVNLADLDDDGFPELLATDQALNQLNVFPNLGDGSFGDPAVYAVQSQPRFVAVLDLNGDGHPDAAVANRATDTATILLNTGDGTFTPVQHFDVGDSPGGVALADVDDDGDPDLISADQFDNTASVRLLAAVLPPVSSDANADGVPDECECAGADLDCSGAVDIADLLALLGAWGTCAEPCPPSCPGDLNNDCGVDVLDLLTLLGEWG